MYAILFWQLFCFFALLSCMSRRFFLIWDFLCRLLFNIFCFYFFRSNFYDGPQHIQFISLAAFIFSFVLSCLFTICLIDFSFRTNEYSFFLFRFDSAFLSLTTIFFFLNIFFSFCCALFLSLAVSFFLSQLSRSLALLLLIHLNILKYLRSVWICYFQKTNLLCMNRSEYETQLNKSCTWELILLYRWHDYCCHITSDGHMIHTHTHSHRRTHIHTTHTAKWIRLANGNRGNHLIRFTAPTNQIHQWTFRHNKSIWMAFSFVFIMLLTVDRRYQELASSIAPNTTVFHIK